MIILVFDGLLVFHIGILLLSFFLKIKTRSNDIVDRYKARLVAKGFTHKYRALVATTIELIWLRWLL